VVEFVTTRDARRLAAALAAVFATKLAVLLQLGGHPLLQPSAAGGLDSQFYLQLAQRVTGGDLVLGPGLYFVSPLYIYFLAALTTFGGGSLFVVKVVQIALGTAGCGLLWITAREWFSERAAWMALGFAAFTGAFTFYEILVLQAALDPFLTAADLVLFTLALRRGGWRWPVLAGIAWGVHALNRPNTVVVSVGLCGLLLLSSRHRRPVPLLAAGLIIALLPVSLRNAIAAGTFSPVPSHGGLNLYIGNNPRADGTYHAVPGVTPNIAGQADDARRVAEQAEGHPLSDAEVSSYFTRRALAWWGEHPAPAAMLFLKKVGYTLNRAWLTLNYSYPFYRDQSSVLRVLTIGPWVLVPLGLLGLWAHRLGGRPVPPGFPLWSAFVPLTILSVATFFVASRYRVPLLIALCVTAGGALDALLNALRARRVVPLAAAIVFLVPMGLLAGWNFHLDDSRAEEETRMAVWLAANARSGEAGAHLARVEASPLAGVAHFRVGQALERAGDLAAAVRHYTRAAEIDPGEAAPREALARAAGQLGIALAQQGRDAEALPLLEQAARMAPGSAPAHLNLAVEYARLGRIDEARAAAERALRIDPGYGRAREFLKVLGARS
jgi:4-amino-4-deoxy-L-arabinose transferase-like glycosyltransferase